MPVTITRQVRVRRCQSCLGADVKDIILRSLPELRDVLATIPTCAVPTALQVCQPGTRGQRGPSEYNIFIGECMRAKHIKGFGAAAPAMKGCAAEWKARHGK